jgi:hypothetical protein
MPPSPLSTATSLRRSSSRSVSIGRRLRRWLRAALGGSGQVRVLAAPRLAPLAPPPPVVNEKGYGVAVAADLGVGRRVLDRRAVEALAAGRAASERLAATSGWAEADQGRLNGPAADRGHQGGPSAGLGRSAVNTGRPGDAARLRNPPVPPRRDGHPERLGGPDLQPRSAQTPWRLPTRSAQPPWAPQQPPSPEVGIRRRRLPGLRQSRPDLRVINGEGTGTAFGRRPRLRPVKDQPD